MNNRTLKTLIGMVSVLSTIQFASAATWTKCATESGTCTFSGTREVRYGTSTKFVTKTISKTTPCTNAVFGDPAYGILKSCSYSSDVIVVTAPVVVAPTVLQKSFSLMSISASVLPNPDKGWDGWSGSDFVSNFDAGSASGGFNSGSRELHCQVSLKAYRTTATLPASFLTNLTASFAKVRSAGMKCVMLFAYNQDSSGVDATSSIIASHLKSLKPVLYANADVISFAKAGFIGAWGEWHSSASGNSCGYNSGTTTCATANANRAIVRDALLDAFPPSVTIQFRYPSDLMLWYPNVLTTTGAFNGSAQSRVGSHNDCQQSGSGDTGTFTGSTANMTAQQNYLAALTQFTPYGGEHSASCATPKRVTCADILAEGAKYHLAWLKGPSDDILEWTNSWKSGGCYNEVVNRIGYRLQLDNVSHPNSASKNTVAAFSVNLRNLGWSKVFSARKLQIVLANGTQTYVAEATTTLTALPEQATSSSTVKINFTVPSDAVAGIYNVYVRAPDVWTTTAAKAAYAIRFANADDSSNAQAWDATNARFSTGTTFKIQ